MIFIVVVNGWAKQSVPKKRSENSPTLNSFWPCSAMFGDKQRTIRAESLLEASLADACGGHFVSAMFEFDDHPSTIPAAFYSAVVGALTHHRPSVMFLPTQNKTTIATTSSTSSIATTSSTSSIATTSSTNTIATTSSTSSIATTASTIYQAIPDTGHDDALQASTLPFVTSGQD